MAKESPADKVKREMEEKRAQEEAARATAAQNAEANKGKPERNTPQQEARSTPNDPSIPGNDVDDAAKIETAKRQAEQNEKFNQQKLAGEQAANTARDGLANEIDESGEVSLVDTKGALTDEEVQSITAGFQDDDGGDGKPLQPPSQDPDIAKEREARFARAQAFERERAARIVAARHGTVVPPTMDMVSGGEEQSLVALIDEDYVAVKMPRETYDRLLAFAAALPLTTPREHSLCGYAVYKITVGMVKDAAGLPRKG